MEHSFDINVAAEHGIEAAILIKYFQIWCAKNAAEKHMQKDGRSWCYSSYKGIARQMPYMNANKVRYCLRKLVEDGVLIKNCKGSQGKSNWWSVADQSYLAKMIKDPSDNSTPQPPENNTDSGGVAKSTPPSDAPEKADLGGGKSNTPPCKNQQPPVKIATPLYKEESVFKNIGGNKCIQDTDSNSDSKNTPAKPDRHTLNKLIELGVDKIMAEKLWSKHSRQEIMIVISNGLARQRYNKNFKLGPGYIVNALKGKKIELSKKAAGLKSLIFGKKTKLNDKDLQRRKKEFAADQAGVA